jgi:hypothetical protein
MKQWQYYALQTNILIACSFSANWAVAKLVFMGLAVWNIFAMFKTMGED